MTGRIRLGFLSHVAGTVCPTHVVGEALELVVEAERLGFHSFWVTQHHVGAEHGQVPSPLVFLAAAAARTSRIRLGVAVVTLPLEDPVRVAEDAAVTDLVSGGRLELGIGPGADLPSYEALGGDFDGRRRTHRERAARLTSILAGADLPGGRPMVPAVPGLARRLWRASGSPDGAAAAGESGDGLLLARSSPRDGRPVGPLQERLLDAYHAALPADVSSRVAVTRTVVPTDDPERDRPAVVRGTRAWTRLRLGSHVSRPDGTRVRHADLSDHELLDHHSVHVGTSAEVVAALRGDRTVARADELLVQFQPGELDPVRTAAGLATVAREVAPALQFRTVSSREDGDR